MSIEKYQKMISNILENQNRMMNDIDDLKKNLGGSLKITGLKNLEERIKVLENIINEIVIFEDELEEINDYESYDDFKRNKNKQTDNQDKGMINLKGEEEVMEILKSLKNKIVKNDNLKPIEFPKDFYQYGNKEEGLKVSDEEINEIVNLVRGVGINNKEFIHLAKGDMSVFAFHDGTNVRYVVAKNHYEFIEF